MKNYVAVTFNLPMGKFFWYRAPSWFKGELKKGQRVVVPFRKKKMIGFVVGGSSRRPEGELKEVASIFDRSSPFSAPLLRLAGWMSEYYNCSLGQALHSVFPFSFAYQEETGSDSSCLREESVCREGVYLVNPADRKFEFVLSRIRKAQELGKQALVLVPEISLISGFQEKMQAGGVKSLGFHSRLSPKGRYRRWLTMKGGKADVAVGTRSTVFSPFPNVGLIIVDEEESTDYKQKETPKYNSRKLAIKRGQLENFPVFLMSHSPSLESWYRAKKGSYKSIHFPKRKKLSSFHIIDLKKERGENKILSSLLQQKIKEALAKKLPVLLFVPRRGYANFLLCSQCGEVIRCPNCSITLNFHLRRQILCHWCGFKKEAPRICPFCGGRSLKKVGWGTQRMELEVKRRFPGAKVERFDLDVFKSSPHLISRRIGNKKVDILVGTQLLIKEQIISMVSVVGIILVDVLLNLPDFRATEHTFHFLNKIRRSINQKSSLLIQTYNPTYYVLTAEDDKFYSQELKIRQTLEYPPFQRWIRILLEGRTKSRVKDKGGRIAQELKEQKLSFLGPSPCPFSKTKGQYRYHIILRDEGTRSLRESIKKISSESMRGSVKVGIDVDPLRMM